ncbi:MULTISPECIES: 3-phosphoglycerate dehydrogenase family protein [Thiomicrorhabdus]|uniref:D-3-phosphoglycerate dehydrogenase n=1 Tax=Thiomicrorhabdus heinhorstiae TaxID=2748010 RepID=A0ABS0BT48_9GAMM|nr:MULTISPECIES: 3-phosphoglycerate dehydrogenase family protein [Thiomicrorhabdus]MBF6057030.1 3-phosphoglycerate dehydrogenase [Thiomicrorhabdus heinhorstiae]
MKRIRVLNQIAPSGLALLGEPQYRIFEESGEQEDAEAILVRSADMQQLEIPPSLLAVGRAGVGVNNIPLAKMNEAGVAVFNAPGANANAVKELVMAAMLMAARNLYPAAEFVRQLDLNSDQPSKLVESGKKRFSGFELAGKKLGVIGLGAIGVKVANAAFALGMDVYGYDPVISVHHAWHLNSAVHQCDRLESLLQKCDVVTVHVPLLDSTRGMLNEERLNLLPTGAILLNFSRGEIVVEEPLKALLEQAKLHAYVTDFPSAGLAHLPQVLSFPHLGASTLEAEEQSAIQVIRNLKAFLEHGIVQDSVNLPNVPVEPQGDGISRIAIVNRNQAGILAEITETLGRENLNIEDMINKSRGEIAYTLIDLQGEVDQTLLLRLRQLPNVLSARLCG